MEGFGAFLYSSFLTNTLNFLVYAAIVALFIVCMVKCVAPVIYTRRVLSGAVRAIKKGENAKRSWQEETFLGKGALYPHWSEYLNNLFFADGEFHNPSNVEDYINEETAIYGPGRGPLAEAMPGMMVSLGFLGTLIGMSMGLQGFSMDDSEAVMQAIRQLVPGMQYAFTTSIVGVIFSIATTLITRVVNGSALRALSAFYAAMSKYAGVLSVDPMTQIAIYQQEQTALIQSIAEDMTGKMAERMAGAFEKTLAPVRRSLDDFISYTTREQLHAMDTLVKRFMQAMNESLDNQFTNLAATIDSTCQREKQLTGEMQNSMVALSRIARDITQVQAISENLLEKFDAYVDKLSGANRMADESYDRIAANVEHLELIARQQNNYLQSVGSLQSELAQFMTGFQAAAEQLTRTLSVDVAQAGKTLSDAAGEIKRSGELLNESHKKLTGGITKDMDRTYTKFFDNLNKAAEQLSWMVGDIKASVEKLPELLDGTAGLYASQANRLTDALRRVQAALDEAVDQLRR